MSRLNSYFAWNENTCVKPCRSNWMSRCSLSNHRVLQPKTFARSNTSHFQYRFSCYRHFLRSNDNTLRRWFPHIFLRNTKPMLLIQPLYIFSTVLVGASLHFLRSYLYLELLLNSSVRVPRGLIATGHRRTHSPDYFQTKYYTRLAFSLSVSASEILTKLSLLIWKRFAKLSQLVMLSEEMNGFFASCLPFW